MKADKNTILTGILVLAFAGYFFRKKIISTYNSVVSAGNFTASIVRIKDFSINGTDLRLTLVLNVINHSPVEINIDSLFTKIIAITPDGTENELLTTNPIGERKISILANNNTNIDVPLRAQILSSIMSLITIVQDRPKKYRLEVSPVFDGVALPTMTQTFDLNDVLKF